VSWVVDGSNLLGGARADVASKRKLVQALAQFARARRTKVTCTFDGGEPEHFGAQLGRVRVVFSGARSADELIARQVANGSGWKVVTSDRGLAARVRRREVEIVDAARFWRELESLPASESTGSAEDWDAYFSDPKNRNIF
jgi:rRNA-processing protein FCF1